MGIQDLLAELKKRHANVRKENVYLEVFRGHRLAVDVAIYAHVYMAVARKEAIKYIDPIRENPKHGPMRSYWLERYFNMIIAMLECGITPIAVFDGPHFKWKTATKDERRLRHQEREAEIAKLRAELSESPDEVPEDKLNKLKMKLEHHITFEKRDFEALEEMFRAMGIPILKPNTEAEAVCSRLVRQGIATGVVTNDGDALAHLTNFMITDIKLSYRHQNPWHTCTVYVLADVLQALELNHRQFTEFCMLLGTDYNDRVKGFGFVKCLDLMQKCQSIENVLADIEAKNGKKKQDKQLDLRGHRLFDSVIRDEIRDYFLCEDRVDVGDSIPVVLYEDGLHDCFSDLFTGPNRQRLLDQIPDKVDMLRKFNQRFAEMQNFVLDTKIPQLGVGTDE